MIISNSYFFTLKQFISLFAVLLPAIVTEDGRLELVEQPGGTEVMDDAVDEVIEVVLAKGGNVAIVDDGTLSVHQQITLILRY